MMARWEILNPVRRGTICCLILTPMALRADDPPGTAGSTGVPSLSIFADETQRVERVIQNAEGDRYTRSDLLMMVGRSSGAGGQYRLGAAAYAMFLNEFGLDHAHSVKAAMRLGDMLAPINFSVTSVSLEPAGPDYQPTWYAQPVPHEQLRHAAAAYELAARIGKSQRMVGKALLKLGWLHRALDDWPSSTAVWERCGREVPGTPWAADSVWFAVDNFVWTNQLEGAITILERFVKSFPKEKRLRQAKRRMETLRAELARTPAWLENPVESLRHEIEVRKANKSSHEVYRSVIAWLRRKEHTDARVAIGRWAVTQADWPSEIRIQAQYDLVNALVPQPEGPGTGKREAADVLSQIIQNAPDDEHTVMASVRRSRLLSELGEYDLAEATLAALAPGLAAGPRWEPFILIERIMLLHDRGDIEAARKALGDLSKRYPRHAEHSGLYNVLDTNKKGDKR